MTKPQSQLDKFKEAAREAECDTDEKAFDEALGKIAKAKEETPNKDKERSKNEPLDS